MTTRLSFVSATFRNFSITWAGAMRSSWRRSADGNQTQPVGTGPFSCRLGSGRSGGADRLRGLLGRENIHLDRVTFRFINDAQAQVAALRAGDVHAFPTLAHRSFAGYLAMNAFQQ